MALPNDSISVTPGTGTAVATQLVGSTEYQVVMLANENGQLAGTKDTYVFPIPSQVHVATANTIHWDIYNTTTSIVRIVSIRQIPNITTAVTGVVFDWQLFRTSAVGTAGTTISAWLPDTSQTAQPAGLTLRSKPTGGATTSGSSIFNYSLSSEETNTAAIQVASQGGLELVPQALIFPDINQKGIMLRQNQGLKCVQVTSSAAGNTGWIITATVE